MLSRSEVKYIQSLRQKKNRDEERVFVAEGVKIVSEFLQAGFDVKKIQIRYLVLLIAGDQPFVIVFYVLQFCQKNAVKLFFAMHKRL